MPSSSQSSTSSSQNQCNLKEDTFKITKGSFIPTTDPSAIGGSITVNFHAEFNSECKCCEYRQLVRGYQRYQQPNGAWVELPPQLRRNVFLDPTIYQEDGQRSDGTKWARPGHRLDAPIASSSSPTGFYYYSSDVFSPTPRETGCAYDSTDRIEFVVLKSIASKVEVSLEFKSQIITVDQNGNQVGDPVSEKTWSVQFTVP